MTTVSSQMVMNAAQIPAEMEALVSMDVLATQVAAHHVTQVHTVNTHLVTFGLRLATHVIYETVMDDGMIMTHTWRSLQLMKTANLSQRFNCYDGGYAVFDYYFD